MARSYSLVLILFLLLTVGCETVKPGLCRLFPSWCDEMPIRNSYNISPALNAMNAYSSLQSMPIADEVRFGVTIGDFSRSFAIEAIESRVMASANINVGIGDWGVFEIVAKRFPVVVEHIRVSVPLAVQGLVLGRQQPPVMIAGGPLQNALEIGGIDSTLEIWGQGQAGVAAPIAPSLIVKPDPINGEWDLAEDLRLFLPPGFRFIVRSQTASQDMSVDVIARELPGLPSTREG